jgi:hypothetical protein
MAAAAAQRQAQWHIVASMMALLRCYALQAHCCQRISGSFSCCGRFGALAMLAAALRTYATAFSTFLAERQSRRTSCVGAGAAHTISALLLAHFQ